ncbi:hypothetical protein [Leptothrix ochracea]|uniref:hypothetical protein n=1 Tax=Leptothrix ochracea TaxID=735331 RepID=UPI0034E2EDBC
MDFNRIIQLLDSEWDTGGFFDRIRDGNYDTRQAQEILKILCAIKVDEDELLPKRLVTLLWYLPSFLGWQVERVVERGGDKAAYERFITEIHNALEEVLGTP